MWKCRYRFFWFVTWPRNQKAMWVSGWIFPTISYHSANFDGHRYCGRADIRFCICQVTTWLKGYTTCWMLSPTLGAWCHHHFYGRCSISNSNASFNFNVYKLPTFILNHVRLSPAPFVIPYKIKTRFQFSSLYFVDHIFNGYLVE